MATILNIETSSKICSVALTKDGEIEYHLESDSEMNHAVGLAPYVEKCLDEIARKEYILDAVAVSLGPGSYTGLRIGLSVAKGLCFSKDIPLIGVSTLKLLATKAMFSSFEWVGDEVLIPMIDARRMEVYTAAYDFALNELMTERPLILDKDSYVDLLSTKKCIFCGDAIHKAREIIESKNAIWKSDKMPLAIDMTALSELSFRKQEFLDIAYSVPNYLKEYQTSTPKNKVLG